MLEGQRVSCLQAMLDFACIDLVSAILLGVLLQTADLAAFIQLVLVSDGQGSS